MMPENLEPDETQILAAMLGISEMVGGLTDIQELLATVVRIVPQLVRGNRCALFTYDEKKGEIKCAQAFGPDIEQVKYLSKLTIREAEIPRLVQKVLRQRLPLPVRDATREEIFPVNVIQALGLGTMLVAPLVCRDRALGLMILDDSRGNRYFTSKEINIVLGIATMAAIAMDSTVVRDELSAEKARLEAIVAVFSDAFLVFDSQLRIKHINAMGQELLGWTAAEIVGKPCSEVFKVVDSNDVHVCGNMCPGKRVLWGEDISREVYRLDFQKKDGSRIHCEVRAGGVKDSKGHVTEVVYALINAASSNEPRRESEENPPKSLEELETLVLGGK